MKTGRRVNRLDVFCSIQTNLRGFCVIKSIPIMSRGKRRWKKKTLNRSLNWRRSATSSHDTTSTHFQMIFFWFSSMEKRTQFKRESFSANEFHFIRICAKSKKNRKKTTKKWKIETTNINRTNELQLKMNLKFRKVNKKWMRRAMCQHKTTNEFDVRPSLNVRTRTNLDESERERETSCCCRKLAWYYLVNNFIMETISSDCSIFSVSFHFSFVEAHDSSFFIFFLLFYSVFFPRLDRESFFVCSRLLSSLRWKPNHRFGRHWAMISMALLFTFVVSTHARWTRPEKKILNETKKTRRILANIYEVKHERRESRIMMIAFRRASAKSREIACKRSSDKLLHFFCFVVVAVFWCVLGWNSNSRKKKKEENLFRLTLAHLISFWGLELGRCQSEWRTQRSPRWWWWWCELQAFWQCNEKAH